MKTLLLLTVSFFLLSLVGNTFVVGQSGKFMKEVLTIKAQDRVNSVDWNPVESEIVSSSGKSIFIWNALDGNLLKELSFNGGLVLSAIWSPDGQNIAALWDNFVDTPSRLVIWNVQSEEISLILDVTAVYSFSWSPDGRYLATIAGFYTNERYFQVWNSHTGKLEHTFDLSILYTNPDYPDSPTTLSWLNEYQFVGISNTGVVSIMDIEEEKVVNNWIVNDIGLVGNALSTVNGSQVLALASTNSLIAFPSTNNQTENYDIFIGNLALEKSLFILKGHTAFISAIEWNPTRDILASSSLDGTVLLWNTSSTISLAIGKHEDIVASISWSPDGNYLASGSWDGTIRIWDIPQDLE